MRISIRTLLTVPFLVLTLTPTIIVGGLFYSNSQKAVEQVAEKLFDQISRRTSEQIQLYLSTPHFMNRLNANAIELGMLDLADRDRTERYFVEQFRAAYQASQNPDALEENSELTRSINHIYIGTEAGTFSGAEYRPIDRSNPSENVIAISRLEGSQLRQYRANKDGSAGERLKPAQSSSKKGPYVLKARPWYQKGRALWLSKDQAEAGWSIPYCDRSTERPVITAVRPVGRNDRLIGVLGSDFLASDIQVFLRSLLDGLEVSGGSIFILDPDKNIFITSDSIPEEACNPSGSGALKLPAASSIKNSIISKLSTEPSPHQGLKKIVFKQQSYYWNSLEFKDEYGLQLSIYIVIPESSFTGTINHSTVYTFFLCLITLAVTTVLGLLIARRITQPVLKLEKAAQDLVGSINTRKPFSIHIENPSELHTLAQSFESMSMQLRDLFVAFGHFVPQNFLDTLGFKDATEVRLGSYKRAKMTILFSDIRSFTSLCETMSPEQNFQFINSYLEQMEPAIIENEGFIDKYIGDAIMALFEGSNSPDHAVQASLSMLQRLMAYNRTCAMEGRPPVEVGIGIHTGEITLGTLGGRNRWDTTVIGSDVNRASRVEGLTRDFGASLLISEQTLSLLKNSYYYRYLGAAKVRGLDEPVCIYEIYEADAPELFAGKLKTALMFQAALELYERQDYARSLEKFAAVLALFPEDQAAKFYLKACENQVGKSFENQVAAY